MSVCVCMCVYVCVYVCGLFFLGCMLGESLYVHVCVCMCVYVCVCFSVYTQTHTRILPALFRGMNLFM